MSQVAANRTAVLAQNPQRENGAYQKRGLPRPDLKAQRAHMEAQGITDDNIGEITAEVIARARSRLRSQRG